MPRIQAIADLFGKKAIRSHKANGISESIETPMLLAREAGRSILADRGEQPEYVIEAHDGFIVAGAATALHLSNNGTIDAKSIVNEDYGDVAWHFNAFDFLKVDKGQEKEAIQLVTDAVEQSSDAFNRLVKAALKKAKLPSGIRLKESEETGNENAVNEAGARVADDDTYNLEVTIPGGDDVDLNDIDDTLKKLAKEHGGKRSVRNDTVKGKNAYYGRFAFANAAACRAFDKAIKDEDFVKELKDKDIRVTTQMAESAAEENGSKPGPVNEEVSLKTLKQIAMVIKGDLATVPDELDTVGYEEDPAKRTAKFKDVTKTMQRVSDMAKEFVTKSKQADESVSQITAAAIVQNGNDFALREGRNGDGKVLASAPGAAWEDAERVLLAIAAKLGLVPEGCDFETLEARLLPALVETKVFSEAHKWVEAFDAAKQSGDFDRAVTAARIIAQTTGMDVESLFEGMSTKAGKRGRRPGHRTLVRKATAPQTPKPPVDVGAGRAAGGSVSEGGTMQHPFDKASAEAGLSPSQRAKLNKSLLSVLQDKVGSNSDTVFDELKDYDVSLDGKKVTVSGKIRGQAVKFSMTLSEGVSEGDSILDGDIVVVSVVFNTADAKKNAKVIDAFLTKEADRNGGEPYGTASNSATMAFNYAFNAESATYAQAFATRIKKAGKVEGVSLKSVDFDKDDVISAGDPDESVIEASIEGETRSGMEFTVIAQSSAPNLPKSAYITSLPDSLDADDLKDVIRAVTKKFGKPVEFSKPTFADVKNLLKGSAFDHTDDGWVVTESTGSVWIDSVRKMGLDEFVSHMNESALSDLPSEFRGKVESLVEAYKTGPGKKDLARKITAVNPMIRKATGKGVSLEFKENSSVTETVAITFPSHRVDEFLKIAESCSADKNSTVQVLHDKFVVSLPKPVAKQVLSRFKGDDISEAVVS